MKKIAILGLGRIGQIHLKNLLDHRAQVQPIAITSSQIGRDYAQSLGVEMTFNTLGEALQQESLDGLVICSPSDTHFEYTKQLIEQHIPVFCEKPLDLSISRIEVLEKLAANRKVPLMVAFNRRFDPQFAALKKAIEDGQVGIPHVLKITSRDPGLPPMEFIEHSGGLFMDMVIHDFDMARFLMQEEVVEVYTKASIKIDPELATYNDFDTAHTILTFESGGVAIIDNSRQAKYGYDQRIEVFGSEGMLQVGNQYPIAVQSYNELGSHHPKPFTFFIDRYQASYREELKEFVQIVLGEQQVTLGAVDAKAATQIAIAAMASVSKNQPIRL